MKVQAVPSLRLYGFTKRKTKRIRLRRLALLIMRVGFVAATALLLAQPYISTKDPIPLPPVAGEHEDNFIAAIVVDDSISSMHAEAGVSRLDASKAAIGQALDGLPSNCGISFCLTTSPYPSPVMNKVEATAFLDKIASIPHQGNLVTAVNQVLRQFAGQPVAILVSAPRNTILWEQTDKPLPEVKGNPLYLHDTSDIQCPGYLVSHNNGRIRLGGKSDVLKGQPFMLQSEANASVVDRPISAHEALLGELDIDRDSLKGVYWQAKLGNASHPWQSLYFLGGAQATGSNAVVIIRENDEQSIRTDQLITGIILSFHSDIEITHFDPEKKQALPEVLTIIVVGHPRIDAAVIPWLEQRIDVGARVLALPVEMDTAVPQGYPEFLPKWSSSVTLEPNEYPLIVEGVPELSVDELTTMEIRKMRPDIIRLPQFNNGENILLRTENYPLLVRKQLNPQSTCWALGMAMSTRPESAVWHPAFPFLIDNILFPDALKRGKQANVNIGDIIEVDDWFGQFSGEAEMQFPDRATRVVQSKSGDSLTIEVPGVYALRHSGGVEYRVANTKREESAVLLEKAEFNDLLKGWTITWVNSSFTFSPRDFLRVGMAAEGEQVERTKRYDLSQLVFWAVLVFLIFEAALSYAGWRQRKVLSQ